MILQNDYHVGLFNGDIGIVLPDADSGGVLRAFFICEDGRVRGFAPARLPPHGLAFAFTVHKAQGSEFREVVMILPELDAPVLNRELIYTAVTRGRENVEVWANEVVLNQAIARTASRSSGLRDSLWGKVSGK
jgi:exodeoxyribonuclease V alpha subunit